jgi:hypothetical protein
MPYQQGSTPQKDSGLPEVRDVYYSPNVFANNVAIALWQPAGSSASFAHVAADPAINVDPVTQAAANAATAAYIANPKASYNPAAAENGVKGDYQAPPDVTAADGQPPSAATAGDLIPFLTQILGEAGRGMWRETGQGGKPSNTNITGIWTSLGFPSSGCWSTDQTAWCAGFVNFALKRSGYRYVQTASAKAIAQNPEKWKATPVAINDAQAGDIVLWPFSHVNFIYSRTGNKVTFCGGNQTPSSGKNNNPSDGDVTISWPSGYDLSKGGIQVFRPSKT